MAPGGLRERSLRAVRWVALLHLLVAALSFGGPLVLARLVTPAELGLLELTLSVIGLGVVVVELGTGPAVVQRPGLEPAFASTVFWVNLASGAIWGSLLVAGSAWLAPWLGGDSRLAPLLPGVGIGLVVSAAGIVPQALLVRRMEFRANTTATTAAVVAAVLAGGHGFLSRGVYGVVWGYLAFASVQTSLVWIASRFRPSLRLERAEVWPLLRFGGSAFGATAGDRLSRQVERSLIAVFLGADSLGLFVLARSLVRDPLRRLMSVFDDILFPGLAALQHDPARARRYYLTAVRCELALFGPAVAFTAVFAAELSALFYGPQWLGVAVVAQLLALHTWRTITGHSVGAVFLSQGRPEVRLRWVLLSNLLVPVTFFLGLPWGLSGYAASCSLAGILGWAVSHTMANGVIGLGWAQLWAAMRRPLLAHLVFAAVLAGLRWPATDWLASDPWRVLLAALPATALYVGVLALVDRDLVGSTTRLGLELLRRSPSRRAPASGPT